MARLSGFELTIFEDLEGEIYEERRVREERQGGREGRVDGLNTLRGFSKTLLKPSKARAKIPAA